MYQPTKLIYNSYIPTELSVGMLFAMDVVVDDVPYLHVYKLDTIPKDMDKCLEENGYPVKPYLVRAVSSNPDVPPEVVAHPDQLGWIEQEGLLYPFDIDDMNYISLHDEGYVYVYMDDETDEVVLEDGKAVMIYFDNIDYYHGDDDDDIDWDVYNDGVECNNCGQLMHLLNDNSVYVCSNNECTSYHEE